MVAFAGPVGAALSAICSLISGILSLFGAFKNKKSPSLTDQIAKIIGKEFRDYTKDQIISAQNVAIFQLNVGFKRIETIIKSVAAKGTVLSADDLNTLSVINYLASTDFARIGEELFGLIRTQIEKLRREARNFANVKDKDVFTEKCENYCNYYSYYCQVATLRNSLLMQTSILYSAYGLHDLNAGVLEAIEFIKKYDLELLVPWTVEKDQVIYDHIYLHPALWLRTNETKLISSYLTSIGFVAPASPANPLIFNPLTQANYMMTTARVWIKSVETGKYIGWNRNVTDDVVIPVEDSEKYNSGAQWILIRKDYKTFHIKRLPVNMPNESRNFLAAKDNKVKLNDDGNWWTVELGDWNDTLSFNIYSKIKGGNDKYYINSLKGAKSFTFSDPNDPQYAERFEIIMM